MNERIVRTTRAVRNRGIAYARGVRARGRAWLVPENTTHDGVHWSAPHGPITTAAGRMLIEGWVYNAAWEAGLQIGLRVHGRLVAQVVPPAPPPESQRLYGGDKLPWQIEFDVGPDMNNQRVEVVVLRDGRATPIGARRLLVTDHAPTGTGLGAIGELEVPQANASLAGTVVDVSGWALLDGRPADRVDVFINDEPPVRARRCAPRPDLYGRGLSSPPDELCAGFSATISVAHLNNGTPIALQVRAVRGSCEWRSPVVRVTANIPSAPVLDTVAGVERVARVPDTGRPRVAVFAHSLNLAGGELYLQELLMRMHRADFADFVVISPTDGALRKDLESAGIAVIISGPIPVESTGYAQRTQEYRAILSAQRCTVAIANTFVSFCAVDAAVSAGVPIIWALHESFPIDIANRLFFGWQPAPPELLARQSSAFANADAVVFETDATRALYRAAVPAENARCITYGIDLSAIEQYRLTHDRASTRSELGIANSDRVLLCIGIFEPRKAQLAIVRAFAELSRANPDLKMVMVGNYPADYASAVSRCVKELELANSIRLVDISRNIYGWYHAADVLVSASDIESVPRSFMEAMAFGTPIVAAGVFGVPDVVHDSINGWLFEPSDGDSLLAALKRVAACSSQTLEQFSDRCIADSAAFDGRHYADDYRRLIEEFAGTGTTAGTTTTKGDNVSSDEQRIAALEAALADAQTQLRTSTAERDQFAAELVRAEQQLARLRDEHGHVTDAGTDIAKQAGTELAGPAVRAHTSMRARTYRLFADHTPEQVKRRIPKHVIARVRFRLNRPR